MAQLFGSNLTNLTPYRGLGSDAIKRRSMTVFKSGARSNRSGSENRKASRTISIRVDPNQEALLRLAAANRGLGTSSLLRYIALTLLENEPAMPAEQKSKPQADPAELQEILGNLGKLGSNVNQIAHQVNRGAQEGRQLTPKKERLDAIHSELESIRKQLIETLEA